MTRRARAASALAAGAATGWWLGRRRPGRDRRERPDRQEPLSAVHYEALAREASDEVLVTGADGVIRFASPTFERRWGLVAAALVGCSAYAWVHPDDLTGLRAEVERVAAGPGGGFGDSDHRYVVLRTGEVRWTRVRLSHALDVPGVEGIVWNCLDTTAARRTEDALRHAADHDAVTGLANRRKLLRALDGALAADGPGEVSVGLVLVNLDGLKAVNDTLGHSGGDQVVAVVAARLAALVAAGDTVARLEGDEFALLRPGPGDDLPALAQAVLAAVAEPVDVDGRRVAVTASSGTTVLRGVDRGADVREVSRRLFREADTALTEAKQRGGARDVAFEPGLRAASRHRTELAADLGAAIAAGQLRVVYQPLVDLATGRTRGFEALVRWTHPRHGVVPPSLFVPIAEERGTVADIGRFVLTTALEQLRAFDRAVGTAATGCGADPALEISVNLSGRHLVAPGLLAEVSQALARSGVEPNRLCLEVTESAVVSDLELASATLAQLRALGVRIALDDFGTGYSSLSYLRRLPVDVLKIDKSFVDDVADVTAAALLAGIASMSSALGLVTVAEGIETAAAREQVRAAGCTWGQGYFFDRPLDPGEALAHLARDRGAAARAGGAVGTDRQVATGQ